MKPTEFTRYSESVAKSLARAIEATREPATEARVWCRDADELILCLEIVRNACDTLNTLHWERSIQEVKRTGQIVLELRNGSAIVFLIERHESAARTG